MTGICKRCGEQVCSCDLVDYLGEPLERQLRKRIEQLEHENAELLAILQRWKNEWVTGGKLTLSGFTCLVHEAIAKHGGKK